VELLYRGTTWTQKNGRDWTVEAFLVSDHGGLGLDMARDNETRNAMLSSLQALAHVQLSQLADRHLEASDFYDLLVEDAPRRILTWLDNPDKAREAWGTKTWDAFRSQCRADYSFDPASDGRYDVAERLGNKDEYLRPVWQRFTEAPSNWPGIPTALQQARPQVALPMDMSEAERWPDANQQLEKRLREELKAIGNLDQGQARSMLEQLDDQHGQRRNWVWASLGQGPLAKALEHLRTLAQATAHSLGGNSLEAMCRSYADEAYKAGDAVLRAISSVSSLEDKEAVTTAIRTVYAPWLDDAARHFQRLVQRGSYPSFRSEGRQTVEAEPAQCLLFVDGLRYDVGKMLVIRARETGLHTDLVTVLAPLPTVTATAKRAMSPVAGLLYGDTLNRDFEPKIQGNGSTTNHPRFEKLMNEVGYALVDAERLTEPPGEEARGWAEFGDLDGRGHKLGDDFPEWIRAEIDRVLEVVARLLELGWTSVKIVTDHGWLFLPGGLPKVALPEHLAESRWARCASIKPGARPAVPVAHWYWNPAESFAYAPGASCFVKGNSYAHGGISVQECLIPIITLRSDRDAGGERIHIANVEWQGLRCRIDVEPTSEGLTVDLRTKPAEADSSVVTPKQVTENGRVVLFVEDDRLEGSMASLVLLNSQGRILDKVPTTIGGDF